MSYETLDRPMSRRRAGVVKRLAPLLEHLYAVAGPSPELAGFLKRHNINQRNAEAYCGVLTVALAKFFSDNQAERVFVFDPDGIPAVVIEGYEADAYSPMDLIAWPLFQPHLFAVAIREADMLGAWKMVRRNGAPLYVYKTPLDWLKASCNGCVPINRSWAGHWLDRADGPFIVQDMQHGREIREMLGFASKRHKVLAPDNGVAA